MSKVTSSENKPLYNSRIVNSYIKFIEKNYVHIDVEDLLGYAKMKPYEVADENHWFTQKQINLFHDKLSQLTTNVNIAREAGRYAASPETAGVMRSHLMGAVGPAAAYAMIGSSAKRYTKSSALTSKRLASNKYEIVATPAPGANEKPFQCENRTGILEAVSMVFTNKWPQVEHPECMHKDGKICRYIISLGSTKSTILKKWRNTLLAAVFVIGAAISPFKPTYALTIFIPLAASVFFAFTLFIEGLEKNELKSSIEHLKYSSDRLLEQMEQNYNNALMTNEIGQAISKQTDIGDVLSSVVRIFKNRLTYDRCMILLADREKKRLLFRAGYGYSEEQLKFLKNAAFHLGKERSKGFFVVSFREQKPFLVNDLSEIEKDLSIRSQVFAKKLRSQAFICCPIVADGESIGILAVDNLRSKKALVHSDMSLLIGVASVLGISIRNAELLESQQRQFKSILQVLAASIDARDPMTSGHSEKVTEYAIGICREMGLPRDFRRMIRVAALLHDYGKIGIPDTILKKPGKLTPEEYEVVKTHADKTSRILQQINFEGIYKQVPAIAGSHHEKVDGSGYPNGLAGEAIPLGARIIAVADIFEAITARRHYRGPISVKKAFEMLQEESGKRLDKKVVTAFVSYYRKSHVDEPLFRASLLG